MLNIVVGEFRKPKTLYDPKIYTDAEITEWGKKAAFRRYTQESQIAKKANMSTHSYKETENGVTFEVLLRKEANGDYVIVSYYPVN